MDADASASVATFSPSRSKAVPMFCAFNRAAAASASSSVSPATKRCTMPFDIPFCTKVRLTFSFSASASITVRPFNAIFYRFLFCSLVIRD